MIFTQCDPFDLLAPVVYTSEQMVEAAMEVGVDELTPVNPDLWHDTADWEEINWTDRKESIWMTPSQLQTSQHAPYTLAELWSIVFGTCEEHPPAIPSNHGGTYAVRRETIGSQLKECLGEGVGRAGVRSASGEVLGAGVLEAVLVGSRGGSLNSSKADPSS